MHPRTALVLVALSLILAGCCGPTGRTANTGARAPAPSPTPTPLNPVRFEEGRCHFEVPSGAKVRCGEVIVPEDHANPAGASVRLAVAVIESQSSARRPDPVILLAGGPGERVVQEAPRVIERWLPMVGERDLILFDQRGAGLSQPTLECPEVEATLLDLLDEPNADVATEKAFNAILTCRRRLGQDKRDLSAFNTAQNAADVDAIRKVLGYEQVNLLGGSYGSRLAQAVMRDYPAAVRSVVISAVLPLEKSFFVDSVPAAPKAINRLLDACAADAPCKAAYPKLKDELYTVIAQLNRKPVPVVLTNPLTGSQYDTVLTGHDVVSGLVSLLYYTDCIPALPRAIHNLYLQDYRLITRLLSLNLASLGMVSRGMYYSMLCTEDLVGRTKEEYLAALKALPKELQGGESPETLDAYNPCAICQAWDVKEAPPEAKQPLSSSIPTLILEGEFDPVTPPDYGKLVASHLSKSTFFTLPGAGHDVLTASDCARQLVRAFFDDPAKAPDGTCVAKAPRVAFDVPGRVRVTLEPYSDPQSGFKAVLPKGWKELSPGNLVRANSAFDATAFVVEAVPGSMGQVFAVLAQQLGLNARSKPVRIAKLGALTWSLYEFALQGQTLDLALAESKGKVYLVMMASDKDERALLTEQLYTPALKALTPLQ